VTRPVVLLAVLVPLHLLAQRLLLGQVVLPLLALPLLAVAAYEALDRSSSRISDRHAAGRLRPVKEPGVDGGAPTT